MVNWKEFENRQREIFAQDQLAGDMRYGLRSMFDFPAGDPTGLLEKPMKPSDEFDGLITKDVTTANLSEGRESTDVSILITSGVAINEAGKLFLNTVKPDKNNFTTDGKFNEEAYKEAVIDYEDSVKAQKWIMATVRLIKASVSSKTAVSKAKKGWLGELFVTLKRTGEMSAQFIKQKGGIFK